MFTIQYCTSHSKIAYKNSLQILVGALLFKILKKIP
jgi:hypothetical protein